MVSKYVTTWAHATLGPSVELVTRKPDTRRKILGSIPLVSPRTEEKAA